MDNSSYLHLLDEVKRHLKEALLDSVFFEASSNVLYEHFQEKLHSKHYLSSHISTYPPSDLLVKPIISQGQTSQPLIAQPKVDNSTQHATLSSAAASTEIRTTAPTQIEMPHQPKDTSKKLEKSSAVKILDLEPPKPLPSDVMQDVKTLLLKIAPSIKLKSPPSDQAAKKIKFQWKEYSIKEPCVILTYKEEFSDFFKQITLGISERLAPCSLLDISTYSSAQELQSLIERSSLRFAIISLRALNAEYLKSSYQQTQEGLVLCGKIPALALPDIASLLSTPSLKKLLWKELCQIIPQHLK